MYGNISLVLSLMADLFWMTVAVPITPIICSSFLFKKKMLNYYKTSYCFCGWNAWHWRDFIFSNLHIVKLDNYLFVDNLPSLVKLIIFQPKPFVIWWHLFGRCNDSSLGVLLFFIWWHLFLFNHHFNSFYSWKLVIHYPYFERF